MLAFHLPNGLGRRIRVHIGGADETREREVVDGERNGMRAHAPALDVPVAGARITEHLMQVQVKLHRGTVCLGPILH